MKWYERLSSNPIPEFETNVSKIAQAWCDKRTLGHRRVSNVTVRERASMAKVPETMLPKRTIAYRPSTPPMNVTPKDPNPGRTLRDTRDGNTLLPCT